MPEELERSAENKPAYAPPDIVPLGRLATSEGQQPVCGTGASNTVGYCANGGVNTGGSEFTVCWTGGLNYSTGNHCTIGTQAP